MILEEFKFHYEGYFALDFGQDKIVKITYDFEFLVEHDEVFDLIKYIDDPAGEKYKIWFCEQGADYYLAHRKVGTNINFSFQKGPECDPRLEEFSVTIPLDLYRKEWVELFNSLFSLIAETLPHHRDSVLLERYV